MFVLVTAGCVFSQGLTQGQPSAGKPMKQNTLEPLQRAMKKTVAFADSHDVQLLKDAEAALESINLVDEHDAAKRIAIRQEMLAAWLAVAAQLDRSIDPNFDPDDFPQESLVQPSVDGISITSNAPENIKDPKARAEFQRAVDENTKKTIRYTLQFELLRLNERVTDRLGRFIRMAYMPSASDQREVKAAMERAGTDPARGTRLLAPIVPKTKQ